MSNFSYQDLREMHFLWWLALGALAAICFFRVFFSIPKLDGCRRTVLVTGAGSGLGRAACLKLAAAGDFVIAMDMNLSALEKLSAELPKHLSMIVVVNVSEPQSVAAAIKTVQTKLGAHCVDSLINFAGVMRGGPLVEMDPENMQLVMDVNVMGTFRMTQAVFPLLRRAPHQGNTSVPPSPKVINIASEISLGWVSACFNAPYSMSKFAVEGMTVALRQELAILDHPVKVVVVNPGAFVTPLSSRPHSMFTMAAQKPGTLFADALVKGDAISQAYMSRNVSTDLTPLADQMVEIVHNYHPRSRYVVGASIEMRWIAPLVPQWVMDAVVTRQLR